MKHSKETIEKIRQSQIGKKFSLETRQKMRLAHLGVKLSPQHRLGVIKTLRPIKKGQTYEEVFGVETANRMKTKMRLAKLGRKMPWNSVPERIGEKSPRWIKDRSQVKLDKERGGPLHKQWSKAVKNRDNWKCKVADNCSGKVVAHHILTWKEHPELRYKINNGITLCHVHHPRRRTEEKRLESYFKTLIATASA